MAEPAIIATLSKFGELATREVEVLLQVGDDIMLLRDRLEWLQASIRDADMKRRAGTDELTRVWLRQTRDVAFEAEDAVDDFIHKVDLKKQDRRSWKTWHRYMARLMSDLKSQITTRHRLSRQITRIKSRLEQISQIQKEYDIKYPPSIWRSSATALTPWDEMRKILVDIEGDKKDLRSLLEDGSQDQRMYISVLGESGSGKETLVGSVYDEMLSEEKFSVGVRYYMPPDSSTRDVLKQIYKKAAKVNQVQGNDFADELRELLGRHKYLVVLSGISSKAMLNCIGASLPDGKNGSKVVLILEPDAQGKNIEGLNYLRLGRWDKKRSWKLFRSRVLGAQAAEDKEPEKKRKRNAPRVVTPWSMFRSWVEEHKERSEYQDKVHAITGGHPLTLVVLAGLLRHKEKPDEWKAVIEQLLLNPASAAASEGEKPELGEVAKQLAVAVLTPPAAAAAAAIRASQPKSMRMTMQMVFSASYDDLPQVVKSCLLYFAAYPKNFGVSAEMMVRMWTAEGFIKPQKGKTLEELGHMHLRELISRYLVQKKVYGGNEEIIIVHSCLLEFLQSEARQASFMEVHDKNDGVLAPASVRRLSIQIDGSGYNPFTNKFPKLRSFICRVDDERRSDDAAAAAAPTYRCTSCCCMLSCVCVNRCLCPARSEGHRHDINFLRGSKLLRLISVTGLSFAKLPSGIGEMIHLRYLRVDSTCLQELPSSIRRLLNLQTLDISKTKVDNIHPKFWTIKALRHVLAEKLKLPAVTKHVEELAELQTLHGVCAPDEEWEQGNCPLDKMTNLRSLEMDGFIASKHKKAFQSALKNMHLLEHLKLKGDEMPCEWLLTEPSLLYLQSMVLDGDITWPVNINVADHLRKVRPNLTLVKLKEGNDGLEKIRDELKEIVKIKGVDE